MARSKKTSNESEQVKQDTFFKCFFVCTWLCCFVSAIAVVHATFESRQYTQTLEELRRQGIGLKVSAGQYELEKSSLASYPRIESIAESKLDMNAPRSNETVLVIRK